MISQLQSGMHRRIRRKMISQYRKGTEINMINFEEELKRFSPIPEVNQAEEAIYSNDLKDISDIVLQMTQDLRNTGSILDNAVSVRARRR